MEPTVTVENLFDPPRMAELQDGAPADKVQLDQETGGWVDAHFDLVDKLSPTARPGDD